MIEVFYWIVMAAVYVLGVCFCLGIVAEEFPFAGWLSLIVWTGVWALLAFGIRQEAFGDHTYFQLRTDRWTCTQRHTEVHTTYIAGQNGQLTPMVSSTVVCDQYTRND
jgi:hypothetical protein